MRFFMEVRRFRTADATAARAPPPGTARSIEEKNDDTEKREIRTLEQTIITSSHTIHQEDEVFEWREILRGKYPDPIPVSQLF